MKEIERKFKVRGEFRHLASGQVRICQGYLCTDPERTVRVRIKGDSGFLTIKGKGSESGMSRLEWERQMPTSEAQELLSLALPGAIEKTRYLVPDGTHIWEVDEFYGDNEGLVIAEIELGSEDEQFEIPSWAGEEVTGDNRYYNSALMANPYRNWKDNE